LRITGVRVNTKSKKLAYFYKKQFELQTKTEWNLALSTRSYLFLDFDCPRKTKVCLNEARKIAKAFSRKFKCFAVLYETPNGYHAVIKKKMKWRTLRSIIAGLIEEIEKGRFKYLDKAHLKACLERGYLTLRLNQIREIATYVEGEEYVVKQR